MRLTAKLALSQVKVNRNRSITTLLGIIFSTAMLTAVCGYTASAKETFDRATGYDYSNTNYNLSFIIIGSILGTIIIAASVVVISNAFRISANERTKQFGILKSVGATKKQIAASVLYEGVFLCVVAIPAGIIVGLAIEFLGTIIITNLLHTLFGGGILHVDSEEFLTVRFTAPLYLFVIVILTSFGTVLLSAWLPARKAAKIPAIDAIRSTGEVKLKRKNVRTSRLTQKVFGFEGTLAAKSLKRSRRNFRATVISLTISIVLVIVASSFSAIMKEITAFAYLDIDATTEVCWSSEDIKDDASTKFLNLSAENAETIGEKLGAYNGAYNDVQLFGIGGFFQYNTSLPDGTQKKSALLSVDAKNYAKLCQTAGVPLGSNILINMRRETDNGAVQKIAPYDFSTIAASPLIFSLPEKSPMQITIHGELKGDDVPPEIAYKSDYQLTVIVQACDSKEYTWFAKTRDTSGFAKYAEQILDDFAPKATDEFRVTAECHIIADVINQMNSLFDTIMYFVYGFVGMLTIIAVTSVISTINTNIRSRAREFAVLESIGMTKSGIKKMLNLESVFCAAKSLIIGLPLGILGAFGLYQGLGFSVELPFRLPLFPIIGCVFGVFIITWITMRYSASRIKNGSIIEKIRGE